MIFQKLSPTLVLRKHSLQPTIWQPLITNGFNRFFVCKIETIKDAVALPIAPYRLQVSQVILLTHGWFIQSKGPVTYKVEAGQAFTISPNETTAIFSISKDAAGYYCHFEDRAFENLGIQIASLCSFMFMQSENETKIALDKPLLDKAILLYQAMISEYEANEPDKALFLITHLIQLLLVVKRGSQFKKTLLDTNTSSVISGLNSLIKQKGFERKKVAEYAKDLKVSTNYLSKCIKKCFNMSVKKYIDKEEIAEAKTLLLQTRKTISEISILLGYIDLSHFNRKFKKHTSFSPTAFRKKWQVTAAFGQAEGTEC